MKIDEMLKYKVRRYIYQLGQESNVNKQKNDRDTKLVEKVYQEKVVEPEGQLSPMNQEKYYNEGYNQKKYDSYPKSETETYYNKSYHYPINGEENYNLYVKPNSPNNQYVYGQYNPYQDKNKTTDYYDVYLEQYNNEKPTMQMQNSYQEHNSTNTAQEADGKKIGLVNKLNEIEIYLEEKLSGLKKQKNR